MMKNICFFLIAKKQEHPLDSGEFWHNSFCTCILIFLKHLT